MKKGADSVVLSVFWRRAQCSQCPEHLAWSPAAPPSLPGVLGVPWQEPPARRFTPSELGSRREC